MTNTNLERWVEELDFKMSVTIQVIETDAFSNEVIVGEGNATYEAFVDWNMITHHEYVQSILLRNVFIAISGFIEIAPDTCQVAVHGKVIPLISLVWIGVSLMIVSMVPILGIELWSLIRAVRGMEETSHAMAAEQSVTET
ncbi:MAG: hypothetical protein DRO87_07905 [Candidatus Thorarchaeota archaeon]|nr:MAG: hypothetical protein DRP09_10705 [Candidatus Thorarchaeota archaeon]RLI56496.1 MAG: hypothetical protein DRO87_07905 [Candidatus Thorarchaeota archaeon]